MNPGAQAGQLDMGKGRVYSVFMRLAMPSMISLFFQNLYCLVDTIFISWVGTVSLAALSLSVPISYLALALAKGVGVGTTTLMSNARGERNIERTTSLARSSLTLMLFILGPMLVLVIPEPCRAIFSLLGAKGAILGKAYQYAVWMALSFPFMGYAIVCESIFMSHGDSLTPMKGMILGNCINLILDPILIFGAGLGIGGASLSTLIGWLCTGLFLRWQLMRRGMMRPTLAVNRDMFPYWRSIWGLGYLISLSMVVMPVSFAAINFLLVRFGPAPVGAWNLMSRIELMAILPLVGIGNALVPFIGFNLGRRDYGRVIAGIRFSLLMGMAIMGMAMLFFLFFAREVITLFRPGPEVLNLGVYAVKASATAYLLVPLEFILTGVSQGLKLPQYSLLATSVRLLALRIPLAVLFVADWGVKGLYWSHPLSMALAGLLCAFLLKRILGITKARFAEGSLPA